MTKRSGSGSNNVASGKKPKLDEDELWDDDFDEAALDKCFELASQVEPNLHNGSVVPDYNVFKNTPALTSSTQISHLVPTTSTKFCLLELEREIRQLKQTNAEKCGEISILRSKLRETTSSIQVEQQKTTNEWREKLLATEKELKTIRSKLEFKNLEIGNLKQQLTDLRKANQDTQPVSKTNSQQQFSRTAEVIQEPIYPLKVIPSELLTAKTTECHILKINAIKNNCVRQINNETHFNHKCPEVFGKIISLEMVFADIFTLTNSNAEELNSPKCRQAVHKLVSVALIMLQDFDDFLKEIGNHLRTEDIQQFEVSYLLNEGLRVDVPQFGNEVGKAIQILSIILLYNVELAEFVCIDKPLKLEPTCWEYAKLIPHRNGFVQTNYYLLNLVLSVTNNIGKYRLTRQTKEFTLSVINFLKSIQLLGDAKYSIEGEDKRNILFTNIFKEIVFLRPGYKEIAQLTFLLKVCSGNTFFLRGLFKKDDNTEMLKANQKGVLSFNNNVCCFCVLAILLQNYLKQTEKLELNITCNILSFIYNSFESSHWIHHDSEENVCVCSSQLYKIGVEFIFRELEDFVDCYKSDQRRVCAEWSEFLKHNMVQTVLSQISFNNYELVEKYVMVLSQYKEIEEVLKQISDYDVPQLNTSEEPPDISYKQFNKDF